MALVWFYTANNHGTSTKPLFQISHVYSDAKQDCFIHILWKFRHWYTMISGFETSWCSAINHLCVATCSVRAMCTMHSATALIWFGDLLDRGYCTSLPHQNGVSLGKNLYCMNNDLSDVTFFILWDCNLRRKPQAGSFELKMNLPWTEAWLWLVNCITSVLVRRRSAAPRPPRVPSPSSSPSRFPPPTRRPPRQPCTICETENEHEDIILF